MDVDQLEAHPVHIKVGNVRVLANILQAIKHSAKQACTMILTDDGMTIGWEGDGKSMQSSVYLKKACFAHFHCPPPRRVIGLQLNLLVDTLNVFASHTEATMDIKYPGPDGEIVCEMLETYDSVSVSSYAHISTIEQAPITDLIEYWEGPATSFIVPCGLVKEASEDLEWTSGDITVHVQRHPQQITLGAQGNGEMEIQLPMSHVEGFQCPAPEVRHTYKYRNLRMAFSNMPKDAVSLSTKVAIDASGLFKVTHMLNMASPTTATATAASDMLESQRMYDAARSGIITFLLSPKDDEAEVEGGTAA